MKTLRRVLVPGVMVLALGGLMAPAASAAGSSHEVVAQSAGIQRTWHATVQCQIVRIKDNHVVGYDRADGTGNSRENAIKAAKANVPVPQGHYKRHCDAKRVW